jgi:hypothetical protein
VRAELGGSDEGRVDRLAQLGEQVLGDGVEAEHGVGGAELEREGGAAGREVEGAGVGGSGEEGAQLVALLQGVQGASGHRAGLPETSAAGEGPVTAG